MLILIKFNFLTILTGTRCVQQVSEKMISMTITLAWPFYWFSQQKKVKLNTSFSFANKSI